MKLTAIMTSRVDQRKIRGKIHNQVRRRIKEMRGKNRDRLILMVIDFTGEQNMSSFERETVR